MLIRSYECMSHCCCLSLMVWLSVRLWWCWYVLGGGLGLGVVVVVVVGWIGVSMGCGVCALIVAATVDSMMNCMDDVRLTLIESVIMVWIRRICSGEILPICCISRINFDT